MTQDLFVRMLLLSLMFLIFMATVELLKRKFNLSAEITRRVIHIGSGFSALLDYLLVPGWPMVFLISSSIVIIVLSYRKKFFSSVHNVKRPTFGEIYLPLGVLGAYFISLLEPAAFIPALLITTLADSFAGLVSDFFKQPRKMWRGSLVFFLVTTAILFATPLSWPLVLLVAIALTLIERYSPLGSDNLTVPAAAALLLVLL